MSKHGRRRAKTRPPSSPVRFVVDGPVISPRVPPYAARWHRVESWAESSVIGDLTPFATGNKRVAGYRGSWVMNLHDDEEAYERGIPVDGFDDVVTGPGRDDGGHRRVSIRLYTWTINAGREGAYEPQWITTGWGMTARSATHAHSRWIAAYADAVAHGIESRRLVATAMELVFWTASESADYV